MNISTSPDFELELAHIRQRELIRHAHATAYAVDRLTASVARLITRRGKTARSAGSRRRPQPA